MKPLLIAGLAFLAVMAYGGQRTPSEVELLRKYVAMQDNIIAKQDQLIKDYIDKCGKENNNESIR